MRKIALFLVVVFTLGLLLSACKTTDKSCPAYGEYRQYQRENVY